MQLNAANGVTVEVSDSVFGADYNASLVHQVVTAYLAGARAGTKAQKNRAAVSGGGSKPYRQKGTGRARAGTTRSPLWRSGGKIFAAEPRSYQQKVNRKMYRGAVRAILSELSRLGRVHVLDVLELDAPKTKALKAKLDDLGLDEALIVIDEHNDHLSLAARNLPRVDVSTALRVDPVSLIGFEHLVLTKAALERLEARFA
ncbi:50S ribosomal protein L4 [Thiohalocapsa halophila]|uniref:Large ribosomal subunit protein uL4 n=1 Tax=Thiohalocapsa halophila TaxID=69359 RepID=A0ABS1CLT0_9GAMM|nr:50S ribosomal protein L4 [Thiohalocapsa halophila]MBK1632881.1 50S ribosomal protein L4 [Thiohalocapsa halophila]